MSVHPLVIAFAAAVIAHGEPVPVNKLKQFWEAHVTEHPFEKGVITKKAINAMDGIEYYCSSMPHAYKPADPTADIVATGIVAAIPASATLDSMLSDIDIPPPPPPPPQLESESPVELLLSVLPTDLAELLGSFPADLLLEVSLDLGRKPVATCFDPDGGDSQTKMDAAVLVDFEMLKVVSDRLGNFSSDNRAGIDGTLHRVSRICNREGDTIGLTLRVGRMVPGCTDMVRDLLALNKSILLLGVPGVGKTVLLREIARVLGSSCRVVVVDTSNEIAGDSDIAHESIGDARRMMVTIRSEQHKTMIEAVQNHTPKVIIIDEIGTEPESRAAADINQRGVKLIATAHGKQLSDLVKNPSLNRLLGGAHSVLLSAEEAKNRKSERKTVTERKDVCVFDVAIEIRERDKWVIHRDVQDSVDKLLNDEVPTVETRWKNEDGVIMVCEGE